MPIPTDVEELVQRVQAGDRRALARAISIIEDRRPGADELLAALHGPSNAAVVGLTGAPGAGKSTLTGALISHLRSYDMTVAVIAVDPSSPFTGGAVLGDRIRMQHHVDDKGVYVRSMSARGHLGGLADATSRVLSVVDAAGFDVILVETVGVGQSETEIVRSVDTTVVVLTPGWGDGVQTAKSGLLEIADILVINKADVVGADQVERNLRLMLELGPSAAWEVPIVRTVATEPSGVDRLWSEVLEHRRISDESGSRVARRRLQAEAAIRRAIRAELMESAVRVPVPAHVLDAVLEGRIDAWSAARNLL